MKQPAKVFYNGRMMTIEAIERKRKADNARKKAKRDANREAYREQMRAWYSRNAEKTKERVRAYKKANVEKVKAGKAQYKRANVWRDSVQTWCRRNGFHYGALPVDIKTAVGKLYFLRSEIRGMK